MKRKAFFGIATATLGIAVLIILIIALLPEKESNVEWTAPEQGNYDTTWHIAADKDYPPYSFIDEDGSYVGHDVELIYTLGEQLGVNVDLELVAWSDAISGISDGRYDALLGVAYSESRSEQMLFSAPTISDPYVAFGYDTDNFSISQLDSSTLSTISGDNVAGMFLTPYGFMENTLFMDTYTECFQALIDGKCDYVIAPYTTGKQVLVLLEEDAADRSQKKKVDNIEAVGPELYNSIYCIAFPLADETNRDQVNDALATLSADGTLDEIYERWLVKYTNTQSFASIISTNWEIMIISILAMALILLLSYYFLERKGNRLLHIESERARIFSETVNDPLVEYRFSNDNLVYTYKDSDGILHTNSFSNCIKDKVYEQFIAPEHRAKFEQLFRGEGYIDGKSVLEAKAKLLIPEWLWYRATMRTITDDNGRLVSVLGRIENINSAVLERDEVNKRATTDGLTGLINRDTFFGTTYSQLSEWKKGDYYAFILLDIDNFKQVNDTFGHTTGDIALKFVADALKRVFDAQDTIGRFGGDEFLVFMPHVAKDFILKRISQFKKYILQNAPTSFHSLSCSCGVVYTTDNTIPVKTLFDMADAAMYKAKQAGKDTVQFASE